MRVLSLLFVLLVFVGCPDEFITDTLGPNDYVDRLLATDAVTAFQAQNPGVPVGSWDDIPNHGTLIGWLNTEMTVLQPTGTVYQPPDVTWSQLSGTPDDVIILAVSMLRNMGYTKPVNIVSGLDFLSNQSVWYELPPDPPRDDTFILDVVQDYTTQFDGVIVTRASVGYIAGSIYPVP